MDLLLGAHVDQADPIAEAEARGANFAQFFQGDPQGWKKPATGYAEGPEALATAADAAGVARVIHAPYVLNLASTNNRIRIPSRKLLQQSVTEAATAGARGVVVHGGHVTANDEPEQGYVNWRKAIDGLTLDVPIFIENTAGGNHAMARYLESIERLWEAIAESPNIAEVGFCLDTCHAHAAGLELEGLPERVRAITGRIDLVHLNNSRDAAGSGADRHAPLLDGQIDPQLLLSVVQQAAAPVILETPCDADGHKAELDWLRTSLS